MRSLSGGITPRFPTADAVADTVAGLQPSSASAGLQPGAAGGVTLATKPVGAKALGGVTDKVQALVGSHLSGMSKEEKLAYAAQQVIGARVSGVRARASPTPNPNPKPILTPAPTPNPKASPNPNRTPEQAKTKEDASKTGGPTPAASALVARTGRASGWRLDDRLVRTAVCPAGQRNPSSHEECLAAMIEAAKPQVLTQTLTLTLTLALTLTLTLSLSLTPGARGARPEAGQQRRGLGRACGVHVQPLLPQRPLQLQQVSRTRTPSRRP